MNYYVRVIYLMEDERRSCCRITRYYSCLCLFDSLMKIIFPLKEHICLNQVRYFLEKNNIQFYFWNDKVKLAAVVCKFCMARFVWLGNYKRSYYQKTNPLYYSTTVGHYIRKFDELGI